MKPQKLLLGYRFFYRWFILPRRYGFRRFARSGYKFFFEIKNIKPLCFCKKERAIVRSPLVKQYLFFIHKFLLSLRLYKY